MRGVVYPVSTLLTLSHASLLPKWSWPCITGSYLFSHASSQPCFVCPSIWLTILWEFCRHWIWEIRRGCEIPWTKGPGRLQPMGSWRVRHDWATFTFTFHFHALEKEMATHSRVLAWRVPGKGEPGGLPSMGSHRVGHDWSNLAVAAAAYYLHPVAWPHSDDSVYP